MLSNVQLLPGAGDEDRRRSDGRAHSGAAVKGQPPPVRQRQRRRATNDERRTYRGNRQTGAVEARRRSAETHATNVAHPVMFSLPFEGESAWHTKRSLLLQS